MRELPQIPETSPFSTEQRAWLNGYFAALFGGAPPTISIERHDVSSTPPGGSVAASAAAALPTLTVLYATQSGNAELVAKDLTKAAKAKGFPVMFKDIESGSPAQLQLTSHVLVVCSTFGDGEMPDSAKAFWDALRDESAPRLEQLAFSVLALGDTNYGDSFCQAGRELDARLEALGATRLYERRDCDVDFDEPAAAWRDGVLTTILAAAGARSADLLAGESARAPVAALSTNGSTAATTIATTTTAAATAVRPAAKPSGGPVYSQKNPFPARLVSARSLNGAGSAKDTRHIVIDLAGSGTDLAYDVGDALGVVCRNAAPLVNATLAALGCTGKEVVPGRDGRPLPLRAALTDDYDITGVPKGLLHAMAERLGAESPAALLNGKAADGIDAYTWGRHVVDVLEDLPTCRLDLVAFVGSLKKLAPRYYSIASSRNAHPGEVHLTVGLVRYDSHGRRRHGVCSGFLGGGDDPLINGLSPDSVVKVFLSRNVHFRLPVDSAAPVIMVGPGTGIAPFRAFLEERAATAAPGRNWLFFGDQRESCDYLYRDELTSLALGGVLSRIDTAFSRDSERKVYVQNRMQENAAELVEWLDAGAHFYVCGDASRMAKDVESTLLTVLQEQKGLSSEGAAAYLKEIKLQKRYQRDVY